MRLTRTIFLALFILFSSLPSSRQTVNAQTVTPAAPEPEAGAVVCPPGAYLPAPQDCLPLGPSEYLTNLADSGIPSPILPLPAYTPDASLNDSPFQYFKVNDQGASLYSSLEDGIANNPSGHLAAGTLYVAYQDGPVDTPVGGFYQLVSGLWIYADGARLAHFNPPFQGLAFSSQPRNSFGWALDVIHPRTAPGLDSPESGITLYRFDVLQIYDSRDASNLTWLLIGPDEWVDSRAVRRVDPHTDAPKGVTGNRWIEVNLQQQTVSVYQDNRLVFATMVSTGVEPTWTRPGLFQIYVKKPTETMSGATTADRSDYYYLEDVPWTMYFDEARAFHGAYWHKRFGYQNSHGCVNMSVGDAHWLYNWANVGDQVYVYDPSGNTPVDPSLYGAGAP